MAEEESGKPYDLELRTELFAKRVRAFVKHLARTDCNVIDCRQLIRSSGSVAGNYIEANEALGRKDFLMKIRTCRKEAKESGLWARLLDVNGNGAFEMERAAIAQEARELMNIFGAILRKSE